MICPKCGAENSERAQFCSLCMEPLPGMPAAEAPFSEGVRPPAGRGMPSPSEWRKDVVEPKPRMAREVQAKLRRFRVNLAIYGLVAAVVVAWLVLSFTVWGNPSPAKRASQLISSLNERRPESFVSLFTAQEQASAELIYDKVVAFLGNGGEFRNVKFRVEKKDPYAASVHIKQGNIVFGTGAVQEVGEGDGLLIRMENHGGRWYVIIAGTRLIP